MSRTTLITAAAIALLPLVSNAADAQSLKTGRAVYESVCVACHAAQNVMVAAPKAGDAAAWRKRLALAANCIETLTDHALEGFGAMPPKGGHDELTRDQIRSAIEFMMVPAASR
jgi:cytochrome c5